MPPPPVSAQPSQPISLAPAPQAFPKPAPILPKAVEQPPIPKVAVQKSESGEIRDSFQKVCLIIFMANGPHVKSAFLKG